jgi:hypothetical protein
MKLYLTRDSVAAGDDVDAPHLMEIEGPAAEDVSAAIAYVLGIGYLPRISGGKATWSVASNRIVAVLAQQWSQPKLLRGYDTSCKGLDVAEGRLRLHFNYHGQEEPETVLKILRRVRLTAI